MTTKKVYSAGRFGSRYGVGIRKRVVKVELKQKEKHKCPLCGLGALKRQAAGIYLCPKCGKAFAGGAYTPETMTGSLIKKMVSQKQFSAREFEKLDREIDLKEEEPEKKEEKKESGKEKFLSKAKTVLGMNKPKKEEKD